jgi:protein-tyrosine kinase
MSKTFELLQQIGYDEDLFRTSDSLPDALATDDEVRPEPEQDQADRERMLQNASLPSVLEEFDEQTGLTSDPSAESGSAVHDRDQIPLAKSRIAEFRIHRDLTRPGDTSCNPSTGATDVGVKPEAGKCDSLPEVRAQTLDLEGSLSLPDPETVSRVEPGMAKSPHSFSLGHWAEFLKAGVRSWKGKVLVENRLDPGHLAAIAREEELRLVQRVFPGTQNAPQVVLFSSLETTGDRPGIAGRVGEILASRGQGPVCVVDANFHSPSLHRHFDIENHRGLAEAALETTGIENFVQQTGVANLWLMPSGVAFDRLTFSAITEGLRGRMTELRYAFRYVVIQAGPLRPETSEMLMSRWTDGVVLVVEANTTPRELAKRVKDNLLAAKVRFLGVVLNNRTFPIPDAIYRRL